MTTATYIARRSLITGHSLGSEYSIALRCRIDGLEPRRELDRRVITPLSRRGAEVLRYGARMIYDVKLEPLQTTGLAAVREFLDSVDEYTFTFDPYGAIGVPQQPFTAMLLSDSYALQRALSEQTGGLTDWFNVGFTVAEA